ncbi:uncharacterized protein LOC127881449 [Dreissena polymorpha]|uniref:BHLH domain-containing protein n=1 Tax=Dreissena polymorpha TaxID=45954 RepID=A0A9D4JMG0_DREPO|nr:uncharacterized protein LOC127881449 [Dreissena polymorpha]KAH3817611.1 hypothetical protein DPMN_119150 [Dreissena polymorpha]
MKFDAEKENKKRNSRPLKERKRRARINKALLQLKAILLQAVNPESLYMSKLEKADLLELAQDYIRHLNSGTNDSVAHAIPDIYTIREVLTSSGALARGKNGVNGAEDRGLDGNAISVVPLVDDASTCTPSSPGHTLLKRSAFDASAKHLVPLRNVINLTGHTSNVLKRSTDIQTSHEVARIHCSSKELARSEETRSNIGVKWKVFDSSNAEVSTYSLGFNDCVAEIACYLDSLEDDKTRNALNVRVMEHLASFAASKACGKRSGETAENRTDATVATSFHVPRQTFDNESRWCISATDSSFGCSVADDNASVDKHEFEATVSNADQESNKLEANASKNLEDLTINENAADQIKLPSFETLACRITDKRRSKSVGEHFESHSTNELHYLHSLVAQSKPWLENERSETVAWKLEMATNCELACCDKGIGASNRFLRTTDELKERDCTLPESIALLHDAPKACMGQTKKHDRNTGHILAYSTFSTSNEQLEMTRTDTQPRASPKRMTNKIKQSACSKLNLPDSSKVRSSLGYRDKLAFDTPTDYTSKRTPDEDKRQPDCTKNRKQETYEVLQSNFGNAPKDKANITTDAFDMNTFVGATPTTSKMVPLERQPIRKRLAARFGSSCDQSNISTGHRQNESEQNGDRKTSNAESGKMNGKRRDIHQKAIETGTTNKAPLINQRDDVAENSMNLDKWYMDFTAKNSAMERMVLQTTSALSNRPIYGRTNDYGPQNKRNGSKTSCGETKRSEPRSNVSNNTVNTIGYDNDNLYDLFNTNDKMWRPW